MSDEQPIEIPGTRASGKKEKFLYHNTLSCLVKALEGFYTLIDFRNESCVAGKIAKVDGFMNIEMEDVIFIDSRGKEHAFLHFFVHHRNIRYVHIPKELRSLELIEKQLGNMRKVKPDKKRSYKQIRAEKYQKEIVQSLNK